jgi:hypothetical protein
MGQRAEQIEKEIERDRGELDRNLKELEHRVRDATDWRAQFQKRPGPLLGAAFAVGFTLALVADGRRRRPRRYAAPPPAQPPNETWQVLKSALLGVLANRVAGVVDDFIPGFHSRYRYAEERARGSIAAL